MSDEKKISKEINPENLEQVSGGHLFDDRIILLADGKTEKDEPGKVMPPVKAGDIECAPFGIAGGTDDPGRPANAPIVV